jgi:hypothetical protein
MQLIVLPTGEIRCLYDEAIDLGAIGRPVIARASHVEPDADGQWWADLSPVDGPQLGPYLRRTDALGAEHDWLETHWLPGGSAEPAA